VQVGQFSFSAPFQAFVKQQFTSHFLEIIVNFVSYSSIQYTTFIYSTVYSHIWFFYMYSCELWSPGSPSKG